MSLPANPDDHLPERERAAAALRRLGHAFVGHHTGTDVLLRIATLADEASSLVERGPVRSRPVDDMKRRLYGERPEDGAEMHHFPDCIVSGAANPMGIAITTRRQGEEAVARVTLGPAFEGAPARAHGGVVAAIFDDVMGFVLGMISAPAYTARLTVEYLAPTPVGEELEFRARLDRRDGRKIHTTADAFHDGDRFATSEALFIAIPPERLGRP